LAFNCSTVSFVASSLVGNLTPNSPNVFITSILSTNALFPAFGFVPVAGVAFGPFFFEEPNIKSLLSRSFFGVIFVSPVVTTVRAVGATGIAEMGDLGAGSRVEEPPPKSRSN